MIDNKEREDKAIEDINMVKNIIKSRERVAKEIAGLPDYSVLAIADWHLKEVEKAVEANEAKCRKVVIEELSKYRKYHEARGMKKAAVEILKSKEGMHVNSYNHDCVIWYERMKNRCGLIIVEANKTLEAEGDTKI